MLGRILLISNLVPDVNVNITNDRPKDTRLNVLLIKLLNKILTYFPILWHDLLYIILPQNQLYVALTHG